MVEDGLYRSGETYFYRSVEIGARVRGVPVDRYALGGVAPFVQVSLLRAVPTHPQFGLSVNSLSANAAA